jgi:hypothetical protein
MVQAANNMALSAEKYVFLVESYLKTELFKAMQRDNSH